jgi:hypothetical protein
MADSTNKSGSWYDWASLFASIYGDRKDRERQGDSKPIPMSPEERRVYDEQWNQYRYSPARHFTNETAFQALQGMDPNAYKFNPQSEYFKGTGFKLPEIPKIDWSQVPKYWRDIYQTGKPFKPSAPGDPKTPPIGGTYGPGTNNAGQGGGGGFRRGDGLGGPMNRTVLPDPSDPSGSQPRYGESIYDFYSRNPGANAGDYLPGGGGGTQGPPEGMEYGDLPPALQGVFGRGVDLVRQNGVQWLINGGVAAIGSALGLPAGAANLIYNRLRQMFGGNNTQTPPPQGGGMTGVPPNGGVM